MWLFLQSQRNLTLYVMAIVALSSTGIWLATGITILLWRGASAAMRHRLWGISMLAALVAPILIAVLPLPRWTSLGFRDPSRTTAPGSSSIESVAQPMRSPTADTDLNGTLSNERVDTQRHDQELMISARGDARVVQSDSRASMASPSAMTFGDISATESAGRNIRNIRTFRFDGLLTLAIWTWLAGMIVSALMISVSIRRISQWLKQAIRLKCGREFDQCQSLCSQMSIQQRVQIVVSAETLVPFVSRFFRPVLVLPAGYGQWGAQRLNVVLAHELSHVRRGDLFWQMIGRLCLVAAWFNPLGWFAMWRMRAECEHACDNAVLMYGEAPSDYADHLVEIAAWVRGRSSPIPYVVAMAGHNPVEQRVQSILDPSIARHPAGRLRTWCSVIGMMAVVLMIAAISPSQSESKPPVSKDLPRKESDPQGNDAREAAKQRIEHALDELTTIDVIEGTSFVDVLKLLAKKHRIPIGYDELSFMRNAIMFRRMPAKSLTNVPLREALKQIAEPVLRSTDVELFLREERGVLWLTANPETAGRAKLSGQSFVAKIEGIVNDVEGKPVKNAMVEIILNFREFTFLVTDETGQFQIEAEYDPQYELRILASDETERNLATWSIEPARDAVNAVTEISKAVLVLKPAKSLLVQVVNSQNVPVSQAMVALAFDFTLSRSSTTDERGQSQFLIPVGLNISHIAAAASGQGMDYVSYVDQRTHHEPDRKQPPQPEGTVRLVLSGSQTVTLVVRDDEDRPVEGVRFAPWYLQKPDVNSATHADFNLGMVPDFGRQVTNHDGIVAFDWLPSWQGGMIQFWPETNGYIHRRVIFDPKKTADGRVEVVLQKHVRVSGLVVDSKGVPQVGAKISANGDGYGFDNCRTETLTRADGTYTLKLDPHEIYLLVATSKDGSQTASRDGILVYPNEPIEDFEFELRPSTRVYGRVTIGPENKPIKGQQMYVYQYGKDLQQFPDAGFPNPDNDRKWVHPTSVSYATSDAAGRYEFHVGAGKFDIRGPQQSEIPKFDVTDQPELEFNFHVDRPEKGEFRGKVVTGVSRKPVAGAVIEITSMMQWFHQVPATTDDDGNFKVIRHLFPAVIYARNEDRSLAGVIEIGPDDAEAVIPISPTATYTARIVDHLQQPLPAGSKIQYGVHISSDGKSGPFMTMYGGYAVTNDEGKVTISQMVVGSKYEIFLVAPDGRGSRRIETIIPDSSDPMDFGDIVLKADPAAYKPPTLEERIQKAFQRSQTAVERYRSILADAKLSRQNCLIAFAEPQFVMTVSLYQLLFEDVEVRKMKANFQVTAISTSDKLPEALALAQDLGVEFPKDKNPMLVVTDEHGKVLGELRGNDLLDPDLVRVDPVKLKTFLQNLQPAILDARSLLSGALEQARRENKRVLIQQTATWCGPCWMLTRFLNAQRAVWEKDYVWVKIDERWSNADDVMEPIRKGAEGGIPWFAILDSNAKVLATSNATDGSNIGYPSASETDGIQHFLKMLRSTKQRMSDDDLASLKKALEKE